MVAFNLEELVLLLVCLGFIAITLFFKAKGDFFLGNKDTGILKTTLSITASWTGVASVLVLSSWIFEIGQSAIWYLLSPGLCLVLMGIFLVKKIRRIAQPQIAEYFTDQNLQKILLLFIGLFYFLILTIQVVGFAMIAQSFEVSYLFGLLISCITIIIYLGLGGFNAVSTTDIVQALLIFITIAGLLFIVDIDYSNVNLPYALNPFNLNKEYFLLFFIIGLIMFIGQENHQRIKAAKSDKVASISIILSGIITFLFTMAIYLLTLSIGEQDVNPILFLINKYTIMWKILFSIGLLGAALSTADTALNITTNSIATLINNTAIKHWIIVVIVTILAAIIAYFIRSISSILVLAFNFYFSIIFPLIFLKFTGLLKSKYLWLIVLISFISFLIGLTIEPVNSGLYASLITLILIFILKLSEKKLENLKVK